MKAAVKRVYDKVAVKALAGSTGYGVMLGARELCTPAKQILSLPTHALAVGVALECKAQDKHIRPETMPLVRLATTVGDQLPDIRHLMTSLVTRCVESAGVRSVRVESGAASDGQADASTPHTGGGGDEDDGFVASAPKPMGAYAHARRVGDLLFLAGLGPRDPATNTVPGGPIENADGTRAEYDAAAQTRACIANVREVLAANGRTLADVIDVQCFLVDMKRDFHAFNAEYAKAFGELPAPPTRTTMQVAELPPGGRIAVELKVIARAG